MLYCLELQYVSLLVFNNKTNGMKKLYFFAISIFLFIADISVSAQVITSFAGNGVSGFSGDGGPALNAQVSYPSGMAFDLQGNLCFADPGNNRIRKIDKQTGIISSIAGDGTDGFGGDGGLAVNAFLKQPAGIAFDASGNMFIADQYNKRIRKVDVSTGIISTVAGDGSLTNYGGDGGQAIAAHLSYPVAVAIDQNGNLLISDYNNSRIRKVDASTGIITTIAGIGNYTFGGDGGLAVNASINFPAGIQCDAVGDIYFSDQDNFRIRKIDASTGIITTVAGNGTQGFSGDGATATSAMLNQPYGLSIDAAGNIFFSDFSNFRIRKIDKVTGIISTVTGTGVAGFSGDGGTPANAQIQSAWGIVAGANGTVFFSDTENQRIRRVGLPEATNINCAAATLLTPSPVGDASYSNPVTGSNIGVTGVPGTEGECDNGYLIYSLWYKFVATQSNHRIVVKDALPNANNFSIQFYLGNNCNNILPEYCYSSLGGFVDSLTYTVTNLVVGQTYYFRVKTYEYNYHEGSFTIYVTSPALATAPLNNDFCNAQVIIPSADAICNPVPGSTAGATPSHIPYSGYHQQLNDVWYSFVATQPYHKIVVKGFGFDVENHLFEGNCNSASIHLDASNSIVQDSLVLRYNDLIPGNTYYFEIGNSSTVNNSYEFTICITSPSAPVNDLCDAAFSITPSAVFIGTPGTTAEALGNSTTCTYHDDDVWYKFIATDITHKIIAKSSNYLFPFYSGIEFFTGTDCNSLVSAGCGNYLYDGADSVFYEATNLVPGNTYYFTVHTTSYYNLNERDFLVGVTGGPVGCTYTVPDLNSNTITANFGSICDFNGDADYADNLNGYTVINPVVPGGLVKLDFTVFNTDPNDLVYIYDGTDITAPMLFSGSGNLSTMPSVASTTGSLTIQFLSDGDAITGPGFSALISNLPDPCPAAVLYVDASIPSSGNGTSWATAYKTLSEALYVANKCSNVTEVRVSQGIYYPSASDGQPTSSRDSSFRILRDGYKIIGGYNSSDERDLAFYHTILSGDIGIPSDYTDNSYHVVYIAPQSGVLQMNPLLDGVIIKDGNADGTSALVPQYFSENGGGMFNDARFSTSIFTLNEVTFTDNRASARGGALFSDLSAPNSTCNITLNKCQFGSNQAFVGGGAIFLNVIGTGSISNTSMNDCLFQANLTQGNGGAIFNYGANSQALSIASINRCNFNSNIAENAGGAIATIAESAGYAASEIKNSVFHSNHAFGFGGALYNYGGNGENHTKCESSFFGYNEANIGGGAAYMVGGDVTNPGNAHTAYEFTNCVFVENRSDNSGAALLMNDGVNENELRVINCTFNKNRTANLAANVLQYLNFDAGMFPATVINCIFGNDLIESNPLRFDLRNSLINDPIFGGNGNIISGNPGFVNAADPYGADLRLGTFDDGLRLTAASDAVDNGALVYAPPVDVLGNERPYGNRVDMGAYETLEDKPITSCPSFTNLYVDASRTTSGDGSSWSAAFKTISEALYVANQCTVVENIYVAQGVYHPANSNGSASTNRMTAFHISRDNIKLYGGYPSGGSGARNVSLYPTILSGDINNNDNGFANNEENNYHILIIFPDSLLSITNNTIIDGFTFTGGNPNLSRYAQKSIYIKGKNIAFVVGGAIYNKATVFNSYSESSPVINNCRFVYNSSSLGGPGIYSSASSGKVAPVLTNCYFGNNRTVNSDGGEGGGGAVFIDGFRDDFPAIYPSGVTVENSVFENNSNNTEFGSGACITAMFRADVKVTNCVFNNNTAKNGTAIRNYAPGTKIPQITGCLFSNNTATYNGSVYSTGYDVSDANFSNCTFYNNQQLPTEKLFDNAGHINIRNSIFGNDRIYDDGSLSTQFTLRNCLIDQPAFIGNSNVITADPLFINPSSPAGADDIFGTADDGLQLLPNSPGIDLGSTNGIVSTLPVTDLRNNPRIANNVIDMGCYEKQSDIFSVTGGGVYCAGTAGVPVGLSGSQTGVSYQLVLGSINLGSPVAGTGSAISFGNFTSAGTYTVIALSTGSAGSTPMNGSVTITNIPLPPAPATLTGPASACAYMNTGVLANYTVSAVAGAINYRWRVPAGTTIVSASPDSLTIFLNFPSNFTSGYVTVNPLSVCGAGLGKQIRVTRVGAQTPGPITGPAIACSGIFSTYSIASVANASTYRWRIPTGSTLISASPDSLSVVIAFSNTFTGGIISVASVSGCGVSQRSNLNVVSDPPPVPESISGPLNACSYMGTSLPAIYTVTPVPGASGYRWTMPSGAVIVFAYNDSATIIVNYSGSFTNGNIGVRAVSNCGISLAYFIPITKTIPLAPGAITGPSFVCANSTHEFSISPVSGASSYAWELPANAVMASTAADSTHVMIFFNSSFQSGNVRVKSISGCGQSKFTNPITVRKQYAPVTIYNVTGPTAVCNYTINGTLAYYSVTTSFSPHPSFFNWSVPAGATIVSTSPDTRSINVRYDAGFVSGSVTVNANTLCESGPMASLNVSKFFSLSTIYIQGVEAPDCNNATFAYSIYSNGTNNAATYNWMMPAGATIVSASVDSGLIYVSFASGYSSGYLYARGYSPCGDLVTNDARILVRRPTVYPVTNTIGATICGPGMAFISAYANIGYTVEWFDAPTGGSLLFTSNNNGGPQSYGVYVSNTTTFWAGSRNLNTGCRSGRYAVVVSTSGPSVPKDITYTLVSDICNARVYRFTSAKVFGALSYQWTLPPGAVYDSAANGSRVIRLKFESNAAITENISVAATNSCGPGLPRTIALNIPSKPACLPLKGIIPIANTSKSDHTNGKTNDVGYNPISVTVYPNPSPTQFTVIIEGLIKDPINIRIFDAAGRTVHQIRQTTLRRFEIGDRLQTGIYFIEIEFGNEKINRKLIKL